MLLAVFTSEKSPELNADTAAAAAVNESVRMPLEIMSTSFQANKKASKQVTVMCVCVCGK